MVGGNHDGVPTTHRESEQHITEEMDARVIQELHSQYVMGFTPSMLDGKVHKLTVRVKKPGMTARARRSYLASPDRFTVTNKP